MGKAAAELKAALVLRYDVEMQVRIAVAERTEVDLGAAPQLLDSAGSSSQICTVIVALLLVALAQLLLMALERQCAAALVCLILEQVQVPAFMSPTLNMIASRPSWCSSQ